MTKTSIFAELVIVAFFFGSPLALHWILRGCLFRVQAKWKSYLFWEALPVLILLFIVIFLGAINWDYEKKMLIPRASTDFVQAYLGPILLGIAAVSALFAGGLIFVVRLCTPDLARPDRRAILFLGTGPLWLLIAFIVLSMEALVVLGPAAITMQEQMSQMPTTDRT